MEINALLMGETDNVVTCVADVPAGSAVRYRKGNEVLTLTALEDIPYCHKIALTDIPEGGEVIKYDESLGRTSEAIGRGHWVSHNNLFSVPRDYESEKAGSNFTMCARQSAGAPDLKGFKFWGYRRAKPGAGSCEHCFQYRMF